MDISPITIGEFAHSGEFVIQYLKVLEKCRESQNEAFTTWICLSDNQEGLDKVFDYLATSQVNPISP